MSNSTNKSIKKIKEMQKITSICICFIKSLYFTFVNSYDYIFSAGFGPPLEFVLLLSPGVLYLRWV